MDYYNKLSKALNEFTLREDSCTELFREGEQIAAMEAEREKKCLLLGNWMVEGATEQELSELRTEICDLDREIRARKESLKGIAASSCKDV